MRMHIFLASLVLLPYMASAQTVPTSELSPTAQRILSRSSSSSSRSGFSPFTQAILDRSSSSSTQPVNVQLGDCTESEPKDGGIFGPIPDTSYCDVFGPVPTLDEYWPRGS